jgi:ATP-dependent exoDNAse (exonuclease V) alpha subunit
MIDKEPIQIMLSYTRKDAQELNHIARDLRQKLGELGEEHVLQTSKGSKKFAENDRVYFLKNDRHMCVKNGSLGTIEKIEGNQLTIKLDKDNAPSFKDSRITFNLDQYNHIDHGYAATIHKAQGVTVNRTYLLASKHMDSHATYVAMSRHRQSADLFYSKEEFSHERALNDTLSRHRAKDVTIDYSHDKIKDEFATHRNIEVSESLTKQIEKNPSIEKETQKEINVNLSTATRFDFEHR